MPKTIHGESIKAALASKGWDQKKLAEQLGVSAQAVTNWLKGADFPRPATLLKLATTLSLGFDQLILSEKAEEPIVAFRKKGSAKTTQDHIIRAKAMGAMLKPLAEYLPARKELRTQIPAASLDYERLHNAASSVRSRLGIGQEATLSYEHLIDEFVANDAVIIPVMWGKKQVHENALHILLPAEKVTFIYLNLDTHLEDFKFWMAHELAHVYTPELAGLDEGEDFADAFAGALLFPKELAAKAYADAMHKAGMHSQISVLQSYAHANMISLFSVYVEVCKFAKKMDFPELSVTATEIHQVRNHVRGELVSSALFKPMPPDASTYISASTRLFKSPFFDALHHMLHARKTGAGYIQQVLGASIADAQSIHKELVS